MKSFEKHITDNSKTTKESGKKSYCGKEVNLLWAFIDVEHAILNNQNGGRLLPCKSCVVEISKILTRQ